MEAWDKAIQAQGKVSRHRGLNYLFTLSEGNPTTLDAATVGDPTRYLNHPEIDANAKAQGDFMLRYGIYHKMLTFLQSTALIEISR